MNETIKNTLYHAYSKSQKASYNREYYQKHKEYWKARAEEDKKAHTARENLKKYAKTMRDYRYQTGPGIKDKTGTVLIDYGRYPGTGRSISGNYTPNAGEMYKYWKSKKEYDDARKNRKTYTEGISALENKRDITDPAKDEREALNEMKKYKKQLNATKVKDSSYPATKRAYDAAQQRYKEARKAGKDKKAIKAADTLLAKNKAMKYGNMLKNGMVSAGKEALKRMNAWINL